MQTLLALSRGIDRADDALGKAVSWLILAAVLVSSVNAIVRYTFNLSSNAWLEMQSLLFGAVFLLGAGYTLLKNEHIRIDIVNSRLPRPVRDWIDILGHVLFVTPLCLIMIWLGFQFFFRSLALNEGSSSAGGLALWPGKLLVPVCFCILLAQTVSELIKRVAAMRGLIDDPHGGHQPK